VSQLLLSAPQEFGTYYEPFLGSGALFFSLRPGKAVLSDVIEPLIETYRTIRRTPAAVFKSTLQWEVSREAFYEVRKMSPLEMTEVDRAARFLYLNKTAWNGLYRVNRAGQFNVPFGMPKSSRIVTQQQLEDAACHLAFADLTVADYLSIIRGAQPNDFVFVDPPYASAETSRSFTHYNSTLFSWQDQVTLAGVCRELADRGVHIVVTNADKSEIRDLYDDFYVGSIARQSTLAGSSKHRRRTTELVFSTLPPRDE
jgi:DNA adenine methylase